MVPAFAATVLTLFPEMFPGPLGVSLAGKALDRGTWSLDVRDIREHGLGKHRTVDDTPAGGGPGMVMRPDVLAAAIDAALADPAQAGRPLAYLSPRGKVFDQAMARRWAEAGGVTLVCGRFEGVDERVLEARQVEEVSLGDFVLSGGEPAAIVMIDAVVRLLPGVVGDEAVLNEESFADGLLEYPQYTRPQSWEGRKIPAVLQSGHHAEIASWRKSRAEDITRSRRPDLWARYVAEKNNKSG
ncbi:tRNA (guanosine(37)-N1)-methyltransferase TrmD [Emcibacter sp. SYSU 3D8]|uniref:tRNA (guanosine(37)-N1)-methyltransferase TrmD n=1 Tax=Emcibacter sp. SYSU 3D8 TaxID=3133969 RepID=UPI0031FE4F57